MIRKQHETPTEHRGKDALYNGSQRHSAGRFFIQARVLFRPEGDRRERQLLDKPVIDGITRFHGLVFA